MFCIGNMTLFMFCFMALVIVYLLHRISFPSAVILSIPSLGNNLNQYPTNPNPNPNSDPLSNPYIPPLRNNIDFRPITIPTQTFDTKYQQLGILTRNANNEILPLMGKRKTTSRYKWQYYTVSGGGNGNLQTKLPVSVKGKSCTGEYGCDEIYNNDTVYVEGFKDVFIATIYENNTFEYIP